MVVNGQTAVKQNCESELRKHLEQWSLSLAKALSGLTINHLFVCYLIRIVKMWN